MGNLKGDEEDIREWVKKSQKGDLATFGNLVRLYKEKAYAVAFSFLRNHEDAQDVSQESFIQSYKKIGSFDGSGSFEAWLLTIVANRSRNRIRWRNLRNRLTFSLDSMFEDEEGRQSSPEIADPAPLADPAAQADQSAARAKIGQALGKLPEQQRAAVHLKFVEGYKISEIAGIMGLAEGTVKTHLFRGMETLKKSLSEEQNELQ